MADLVTTGEVTAALPNLTAAQVAELATVISSASRALEAYCDRVLASTAVDETHAPGASRTIRLKQYPVSAINRVASWPQVLLTAQCTDSATSRATITTTTTGDAPYQVATGLSLYSMKAGIATTTPLLYSTYTTLGTLATAINAVSGWATVVTSGYANWATADLSIDLGSRDALATPASLWAFVRDVSDYDFVPTAGRLTLGSGWPNAIPSGSGMAGLDTFRFPDRAWGVDARLGQIRVSYTAGYTTIPADLKRACIGLISNIFDGEVYSGLIKEVQLGTNKQVLADQSQGLIASSGSAGLLGPYRRRGVA